MTTKITGRRGVLIALIVALLAVIAVLALTLGGGTGPSTAQPPAKLDTWWSCSSRPSSRTANVKRQLPSSVRT